MGGHVALPAALSAAEAEHWVATALTFFAALPPKMGLAPIGPGSGTPGTARPARPSVENPHGCGYHPSMIDAFASAVALVLVATLVLVVWRLLRGPPRGVASRAGRVALALLVAVVLTAFGAYRVMSSRSYQTLGTLVPRVATSAKVVALTFDDGPSLAYDAQVLAALHRYHARATFYVVGSRAERDPAALRTLVAAGMEIGDHTWPHRRLVFVSESAVAQQIEPTDRVIRAAGYRGPVTVRPPNCKKLVAAPYYLWRHKRTTVTWDLEPDSIGGIAGDPVAMLEYVTAHVRPGSIILMHAEDPSRAVSRRALPLILRRLSAEGYRFVTVTQLMAAAQH